MEEEWKEEEEEEKYERMNRKKKIWNVASNVIKLCIRD